MVVGLSLERRLDKFEKCLKHSNPIIVAEVDGRIDNGRLAEALQATCKSDAVLGGRIEQYNGEDPRFSVPNGEVLAEFHVRDEARARALLKGEVEFDAAKSLVSLYLVQGDKHDILALRVNHSIVDGPGLFYVLNRLWRYYDTGGSEVVGCDSSLPASPLELLNQRWGGIPDAEYRLGGLWNGVPDARLLKLSRDRIIETIQLTKNETTRLLQCARSQKTTMHSMLCGAIFLAQHKEAVGRSETGNEARESAPMLFISSVDLRNRVSPPVGVRETTNFVAACAGTVEVSTNSKAAEVGRNIRARMDTAVGERKLRLLSDLGSFYPKVETPLEQKWAIAQVNNARVIPLLETSNGRMVTDVRMVAPRNDAGGGPFPFYAASTYGGHLTVLCNYPSGLFSADEIRSAVCRIEKQLREAL